MITRSIKDKAQAIDFTNLGRDRGARLHSNKSSISSHAEALFRDEGIAIENSALKLQLEQFEGASATRHIDPKKVHASSWVNRSELSFTSDCKEFEALKQEILASNGNIQPIKVRPHPTLQGEYEIVFGHRRHRACLELEIDVFALIEQVDDVTLFVDMDRENRNREALSPYEAGVTYTRALDKGLFVNMKALAQALGIDPSNLRKYVLLARLPPDVIAAFRTPLEIQQGWAIDLDAAVQKDPERVLAVAKQLQQSTPRLGSKQVFTQLTAPVVIKPSKSKALNIVGDLSQKASLVMDPVRKTVVVNLRNISPNRFEEIHDAVKRLISKTPD
jgi:ParB family chromosome partitioning protein